jgi:methylenetetrahydrofolate reductase (NADPH)
MASETLRYGMLRIRQGLASPGEFVVTCELVPGRGYTGVGIDNILKFAQEARDSRHVHGLSITDNAGGNPALWPDVLGPEIAAIGCDLMVHFSCKDMNRNMIEARAYAMKRAGITNLLVITGDYPVSGFFGQPKPVFDIDSVTALHYLQEMNGGLEAGPAGKGLRLEPTDFLLGAVASPFKATEASAVMQYIKLEKKLRAGAHFIVTQLGYDARRSAEFIRYVRQILRSNIPVLGSVYVLSAGAARFMNRGEVPGCYVDDRLVADLTGEAGAPDKGKGARLERAARQVAILKGLGYNGAHVEGLNLKFGDVSEILQRAEAIGDNWRDHVESFDYSPLGSFFLFEGSDTFDFVKNPSAASLRQTRRPGIASPVFWAMRILHNLIFIEGTPGYRMMVRFSRFAEHRPFWYRLGSFLELAVKRLLFDCRQCDDCALFEMYYVCPESQCPKAQRLGPCGGSRIDGRCEVFAYHRCVWERVYPRARNRRQLDKLRYIIPPRNWKLYETSSWINYYLKYDHSAVKIELPERAE